jgi:hypothetical protein
LQCKQKRKIMGTMDSQAAGLAQVLKDWRTSNGISVYAIAKFENTRIENIQKVEEGVGNMVNLVRYLDFIRCKDRPYLDKLMSEWCQHLGFE